MTGCYGGDQADILESAARTIAALRVSHSDPRSVWLVSCGLLWIHHGLALHAHAVLRGLLFV